MEWWRIIIIIVVVWWIVKSHYEPKRSTNVSASVEDNITEEDVLKEKSTFEKNFEHSVECGVPDALSGQDIYIYRSLMCVWFSKLSSDNRYNDEMIQKIRRDWLDYMYSLESSKTLKFLSLEAEEKEKQESYENKWYIEANKVCAIENAFASLIGKKAVDELTRIRGLNYFDFNKYGNLAPDGFEFNSEGKLNKKKK